MRSINTSFFVAFIAIIIGFLPLFLLIKIEMIGFAFALISYVLLLSAIMIAFLLKKPNGTGRQFSPISKNPKDYCISEHVGDAFLRFNQQGEVSYISDSAKKLFNCQIFELTGSGLIERIHVLDRPLYLKSISDALNIKQKKTIAIRMRSDSSDGALTIAEYIFVEIVLSPIPIANNSFELIALLRNVTKEKNEQDEIIVAQKQAETSNNEKSQFLAIVGHELRTPLNAIVGFSDMMVNGIGGELNPTQKEYAQMISQSGHHLVGIVNSLLDMSRIKAGKFELDINSFSPNDLISPSIQMVSKMAGEKNIEIEVEKDAYLPDMEADERACRQIIINLLSNAIKFSNENSKVSLSLQRRSSFLEILVKDKGIGMSAEYIAKLGEPFLQANSSTNRNHQGAGLGISIVKGLIDLHKGSFNVNSKLNVGTKITILLPLELSQNLPEKNIISLQTLNEQNKKANIHQQITSHQIKKVAQ